MNEMTTEIPHILYSCYSSRSTEGEAFIPEHVFGYLFSGNSEISVGGKSHQYNQGDFRFFRKNQLSRYTKYPPPGGEYRSITVLLDKATLQAISEEQKWKPAHPYLGEGTLLLPRNRLFTNYIESLSPYMNDAPVSKALTDLKVREAIMILVETHPALKDILFDFSEPGKIDLEAYMNQHYRYNVELSRFAYLTGRSLATFKRDFEKIYHESPKRWLLQRRLKEAHYLIGEKGRKASEVYLDLGFEDLSHFSFAFKKVYGVAPSAIHPS